MEFTGIVAEIAQIEIINSTKTGKSYEKCSFVVVEDKEEYPQGVVIETFGKSTELIPTIAVGDVVKVNFNMTVSDYKGKKYGKNNLWKVDVLQKFGNEDGNNAPNGANYSTTQNNAPKEIAPDQGTFDINSVQEQNFDDLPF